MLAFSSTKHLLERGRTTTTPSSSSSIAVSDSNHFQLEQEFPQASYASIMKAWNLDYPLSMPGGGSSETGNGPSNRSDHIHSSSSTSVGSQNDDQSSFLNAGGGGGGGGGGNGGHQSSSYLHQQHGGQWFTSPEQHPNAYIHPIQSSSTISFNPLSAGQYSEHHHHSHHEDINRQEYSIARPHSSGNQFTSSTAGMGIRNYMIQSGISSTANDGGGNAINQNPSHIPSEGHYTFGSSGMAAGQGELMSPINNPESSYYPPHSNQQQQQQQQSRHLSNNPDLSGLPSSALGHHDLRSMTDPVGGGDGGDGGCNHSYHSTTEGTSGAYATVGGSGGNGQGGMGSLQYFSGGTGVRRGGSANTIYYEEMDDSRPSCYNPFEVKRRRRTTRYQFKALETTFLDNPKPSASTRKRLSEELDMSLRAVQVWFQNRRAKAKSSNTKEHEPSRTSSSLSSAGVRGSRKPTMTSTMTTTTSPSDSRQNIYQRTGGGDHGQMGNVEGFDDPSRRYSTSSSGSSFLPFNAGGSTSKSSFHKFDRHRQSQSLSHSQHSTFSLIEAIDPSFDTFKVPSVRSSVGQQSQQSQSQQRPSAPAGTGMGTQTSNYTLSFNPAPTNPSSSSSKLPPSSQAGDDERNKYNQSSFWR